MALLSDLVKAVADSEGLDVAMVAGVARYLREAGLITQAGRGRGAARMSSQDAARLLIGVNGTSVAKIAPLVLERFERLNLVVDQAFASEAEWRSAREGDDPIDQILKKGTPLLDTLRVLIEQYAAKEGETSRGDGLADVFIEFKRPHPECTIEISDTNDPEEPELYASAVFSEPSEAKSPPDEMPDRVEKVTITHRTLRAVGRALAN